MAQFGFYMAGAATGVGALGLLIAWDRNDRGPEAADDPLGPASGDIGLYSWIGLTTGAQLMKIKSMSPVQIPSDGCPDAPDGGPHHDYVARFEVKPGGTGISPIVDLSFEIFEGSVRVYGVSPEGETLKVELAEGTFGLGAASIQDRLTLQAWEDSLEGWALFIGGDTPGKEIWRDLMTPNLPLKWV